MVSRANRLSVISRTSRKDSVSWFEFRPNDATKLFSNIALVSYYPPTFGIVDPWLSEYSWLDTTNTQGQEIYDHVCSLRQSTPHVTEIVQKMHLLGFDVMTKQHQKEFVFSMPLPLPRREVSRTTFSVMGFSHYASTEK